MKQTVIAALAVALLSSTAAVAADPFPKAGSSKADEAFAAPREDFRGLYIGLRAGGEFANTELGGFDGIGADGLIGEAVVGFDIRMGSFVIGPRIVGSLSNTNIEIGGQDLVTHDGSVNFGGRAGVVFNRTLVYIHGGYELVFLSSDNPGLDNALNDADLAAYTAGVGVETPLIGNINFVAEGAYVVGTDDLEDTEALRATAGINVRF
jgi:opacity protein-like surface antigen